MVSLQAAQFTQSKHHMAYRFKLDEPFDKGFRRIAREQLDRTIAELTDGHVAPSGIHESRKALKRLRALLRLAAPAIGDKAFARRNRALRRIARLLSGSRDTAVIAETLDGLVATTQPGAAALDAARDLLNTPDAGRAVTLDADIAETARVLLLKEARQFVHLPFKGKTFAAVHGGLEHSYREARKTLRAAYKTPSDDGFHELRKTVQWHWRHMTLLSRAWPDAFATRVSAARELSQILGDDHDLAMLRHAVRTSEMLAEEHRAVIEDICLSKQAALRRAAEHRAHRLFAEPAGAFVRRIGLYWRFGPDIKAWPPEMFDHAAEAVEPAPAPAAGDLKVVTSPESAVELAAKTPGRSQSQRRA